MQLARSAQLVLSHSVPCEDSIVTVYHQSPALYTIGQSWPLISLFYVQFILHVDRSNMPRKHNDMFYAYKVKYGKWLQTYKNTFKQFDYKKGSLPLLPWVNAFSTQGTFFLTTTETQPNYPLIVAHSNNKQISHLNSLVFIYACLKYIFGICV